MLNTTKITYGFLYLMLLSPLLSYLSFGVLGLRPVGFYFQIFTIVYGCFFIIFTPRVINMPTFALLALFWSVYLLLWSFAKGEFLTRGWGLLSILLNNPSLAIFFILVIIYNTRFSNAFIKNTISILMLTVLLSVTASFIQFWDGDFLNARPLWREDGDVEFLNIYQQRRSSIFGFIDQNAVGLSFMPLLAVLAGYLLLNKSKLFFIFLAAGGFVAFFTNARYIIVSFFIITLQFLFFKKIRALSAIKYIALIIAFIYIGSNAFTHLGYDFQDWSKQRLFREEHARQASVLVFLEFFPRDFLLGNGDPRNQAIRGYSESIGTPFVHIAYLEVLVGYGIVGGFFLFGFWFLLAKRLYKTAKKTNYWGAFFAFLVFFFSIVTMTSTSIFYYGLIFALVFDKYYGDLANEVV